jgi:hypothetical protein
LLAIAALAALLAWIPICGAWFEPHSDAFYAWVGEGYMDQKGRDFASGAVMICFVFGNLALVGAAAYKSARMLRTKG